jgi:hypothetical protein
MASKRKIPVPLSAQAKSAGMFPIVVNLPSKVYAGIGKVIAAHAILEVTVSELLYDLMTIDYPLGRVGFKYMAASTMFSIIRRLLDLHGITPKLNVADLSEHIGGCCTMRDQLAHGVWVQMKIGDLGLRLSEGKYDTPFGTHDSAFIPQVARIPSDYFDNCQAVIFKCVEKVKNLQTEVKSALSRTSEYSV